MYCSQFDSYVLPITCIHMLHVLFSIWLIFTTHYLYTRVTCIALNLTRIYYPLPVYTFYMYCSQFNSYLLPITCHTRFTCIVLNLTHIYYPLPVYTCYMYCSQFDSYVLLMVIWLICTTHSNLTHMYYS